MFRVVVALGDNRGVPEAPDDPNEDRRLPEADSLQFPPMSEENSTLGTSRETPKVSRANSTGVSHATKNQRLGRTASLATASNSRVAASRQARHADHHARVKQGHLQTTSLTGSADSPGRPRRWPEDHYSSLALLSHRSAAPE